MQQTEELPQLGERLTAGPADRDEAVACPVPGGRVVGRPGPEEDLGRVGLHDHGRDVVRDDVVQLASEPHALVDDGGGRLPPTALGLGRGPPPHPGPGAPAEHEDERERHEVDEMVGRPARVRHEAERRIRRDGGDGEEDAAPILVRARAVQGDEEAERRDGRRVADGLVDREGHADHGQRHGGPGAT